MDYSYYHYQLLLTKLDHETQKKFELFRNSMKLTPEQAIIYILNNFLNNS